MRSPIEIIKSLGPDFSGIRVAELSIESHTISFRLFSIKGSADRQKIFSAVESAFKERIVNCNTKTHNVFANRRNNFPNITDLVSQLPAFPSLPLSIPFISLPKCLKQ